MKLPLELLLLISTALSAPLVPRSASFPHLKSLTPLSRDLSTTDSRFPEKYFHESIFHPHYDGRFAASVLPSRTRAFHMRLLLRSYMAAMDRAGVRTWVMHGSLLGWWWNRAMFPWDSDLDFCVEEVGMRELGGWWNMTVHAFSAKDLGLPPDAHIWDHEPHNPSDKTEDEEVRTLSKPPGLADSTWEKVIQDGKKYLLEINPHYTDSSTSDRHNVIDARWIDTSTGLFIDITTMHFVPSAAVKNGEKHQMFLAQGDNDKASEVSKAEMGEMYTKDTHLYTTASLFPLRQTTFEGTKVFVPYAYEQLLLEEYGPKALTESWFSGYQFDKESKKWALHKDT
jgi:hypothetical protein